MKKIVALMMLSLPLNIAWGAAQVNSLPFTFMVEKSDINDVERYFTSQNENLRDLYYRRGLNFCRINIDEVIKVNENLVFAHSMINCKLRVEQDLLIDYLKYLERESEYHVKGDLKLEPSLGTTHPSAGMSNFR